MVPRGIAALSRRRWLFAGACLWLLGCEAANIGRPPPGDRLFFPGGMLLDPRSSPQVPARWLFVANGNNDLFYNAGTVTTVDLDRFFRAWTASPATMAVDPYCGPDRCVLLPGTPVTAEQPCRRLAALPQVVECTEAPFMPQQQTDEGGTVVRVGDFATLLTSSCEDPPGDPARGCQRPRIWLPVRGDPSLTFFDLLGEPNEPPILSCGQGDDPEGRCDDNHRLTHLRNDTSLPELDREPFNMLISPSSRLGYVAHADGDRLALVALDGVGAGDQQRRRPALVEDAPVFNSPQGLSGGFGLAERPCDPANAPSITLGCTRPLIYASFRYARVLISFTVQGVEFADPAQAEARCAAPGDLGEPGRIVCDPRVRSIRSFSPGGLDDSDVGFGPVMGDLAFSDEAGETLLALQTNPGALLRLNTAVGPDGEPFDTPSGPPLELCDEPTRMELYQEAGQSFALVSCYRSALIYVVDLDGFRVVDTIVAGTGPYELQVDHARRVLYTANSLEGSISVVDLAADRPTRFKEIARIGLQEPFSQ